MTTQRKIDPDTGLPALPEGQFWKVVKSDAGEAWFDASYGLWPCQRRRRWWGWRILIDVLITSNEDELCPELILKKALFLLDKYDETVKRNAKVAGLLGDYPPKTLAVTK